MYETTALRNANEMAGKKLGGAPPQKNKAAAEGTKEPEDMEKLAEKGKNKGPQQQAAGGT